MRARTAASCHVASDGSQLPGVGPVVREVGGLVVAHRHHQGLGHLVLAELLEDRCHPPVRLEGETLVDRPDRVVRHLDHALHPAAAVERGSRRRDCATGRRPRGVARRAAGRDAERGVPGPRRGPARRAPTRGGTVRRSRCVECGSSVSMLNPPTSASTRWAYSKASPIRSRSTSGRRIRSMATSTASRSSDGFVSTCRRRASRASLRASTRPPEPGSPAHAPKVVALRVYGARLGARAVHFGERSAPSRGRRRSPERPWVRQRFVHSRSIAVDGRHRGTHQLPAHGRESDEAGPPIDGIGHPCRRSRAAPARRRPRRRIDG